MGSEMCIRDSLHIEDALGIGKGRTFASEVSSIFQLLYRFPLEMITTTVGVVLATAAESDAMAFCGASESES